MFILFFLVHIFFAGAFFLLRGYPEASGFVLLGILSFFLFWPFRLARGEERSWDVSTIVAFSHFRTHFKERAVIFFRDGVLPLSVGFLYLALFWIVWSLSGTIGISVSTFAHSISCGIAVVAIAFLLSPLREWAFTLEIVRINLLIISCIQIGILLVVLFGRVPLSVFAFFSELGLLGAWSVIFFEEHRRFKTITNTYLLFFFVFLYIFLTCVVLAIFAFHSILTAYACVGLVLGVAAFECVSHKAFRANRAFVRLFSILVAYAGTLGILGLYMLDFVGNWVVGLLSVAILFNMYVHRRFENYLSLFFCVLIIVGIFEHLIGLGNGFFQTLLFGGILGMGIAFWSLYIQTNHAYDQYFFQISAITVSIAHFAWYIVRYGMLGTFEFSILLLFFSALLFVSYFRIAK